MATTQERYSWTIATAAATALAIQFLLLSQTFPLGELLSQRPLFYIDGAYHWYQIHVARELGLQGRLTGYDPYFAAGYLGGVTLNASAKVPALLALLFNGLQSETQVYKLYVFVSATIAPAFVAVAASIWRSPPRATWIATGLGVCIWWASAFRWYHTAGMVSFVLACFLSLPYVALLIRSIGETRSTLGRVVILGGVGAAGTFLHPLFPVLIALATLPHLLLDWREIEWRHAILLLAAVSITSLVPNLPWLIGMLRADATIAGVNEYQTRVDITVIPKELAGVWRGYSMGAKIYSGLVAASVAAAAGAASALERKFARISILTWAVIVLFAAVGAALPGAGTVQPNRFAVAAYLYLVLPSAIGIGAIFSWLKSRDWRLRGAATALSAICAVSFGWSATEVAREVSRRPIGHYGPIPPETQELGDKSKWLISWLSMNTTKDGRVLFEMSKGRIHDHAHMAGYYAISADREFIGGPYPFMFKTSFWDETAFGSRIDKIPQETFRRYLDVYNIGWIVVHTPTSKQYLASMLEAEPTAEYADLRIYRVRRPLNFFLSGSGRVEERGINRLVLSDMKPGEAVISYHYVSGLVAEAPATVEPVEWPGAIGPLVKVKSGATDRVVLSVH